MAFAQARDVLALRALTAGFVVVLTTLMGVAAAGAADPPEPTVSGGFDDTTLIVGQSGTLTLTIENRTTQNIDFLNVTNEFPSELDPNTATSSTTCKGDSGFEGQVFLAYGIVLRPDESCEISIDFTASGVAAFTNNDDAIEIFTAKTPEDEDDRFVHADPSPGPSLTITIEEPDDPTFTTSATPSTMVIGQTGTATMIITNPNPAPMENIQLEISPSSRTDVDTTSLTTTCTGTTRITSFSVYIDNATLAPNASCRFSISYVADGVGDESRVGFYAEQDPAPPGTSVTGRNYYTPPDRFITVEVPDDPTFTTSATPSTMVIGQTGTATMIITNPNPAPMENIQLEIRPSFRTNVDTTSLTTTCTGTTRTTSSRVYIDNATLAPNASCRFSISYVADGVGDESRVGFYAEQDPAPPGTSVTGRNYYTPPDRFITIERVPVPLTLLDGPCAVYDSRTAGGAIGGTFDGGDTRRLTITGPLPADQGVGTTECVPTDATAVVFTISAIDPLAGGNLRLSPAGIEPTGGVVNYAANNLNNANTVTIPLDAQGRVDLTANGGNAGEFLPSTDARLVAIGYYSLDGTLDYNPVTPCAAADSRINQDADGIYEGPFSPGPFPNVDVIGEFPAGQGGGNTNCGVPINATAVLINVVAINPAGGTGHLSVGPGGTNPTEPLTPFADIGMSNATTTIAAVDANGDIAINIARSSGTPTTHVRIVILGYYDSSGLNFWSVTPCAAFDTRTNQNGAGAFIGERIGDSTTTYDVAGTFDAAQGGGNTNCDVPDDAEAVLINLVAINALQGGNLRISAGGTEATGGVLNFDALTPAMNNPNAVVVPLNNNGELDVFTNGGTFGAGIPLTHIRGIILGYYD